MFTRWESPPFRAIFVPGKKNLRRLTGVRQENVPRHGANQAPKERWLTWCEHALDLRESFSPIKKKVRRLADARQGFFDTEWWKNIRKYGI
jgi:hypothetical protein